MAFKGVTFSGQNVTPKNDGGLYQAHYGDGILWGCSMALSGDDLVIQSGEFIMGGRVVQVDGATNVDLSGRTLQTGYIQVIMNADLTQGEGNQWYTTFVESATTTFPALTQGNINDTDTLYQLELAVVQISGGNLTSVYSTMSHSPVIAINSDGSIRGRIITSDIGASWAVIAPDDSTYGGMYAGNDGSATIWAKNNLLYIRPNGITSSAGQIYYDTSGIQHGGHPMVIKDSESATKSVAVNTWVNLDSITGLDATGIYSIYGKTTFTPSANTGSVVALTINNSSSGASLGFTNSTWSASTSGKQINVAMAVTGSTAYYLNVNSASVSGTASYWHFRAVRLG